MYVLAQDSTASIDYSAFLISTVSDSATAVMTYSQSRAGAPPLRSWTVGDTFAITGATGTDAAVYNITYTVTSVSESGSTVTVNTSTDTSAAAAALNSFNGGANAMGALTATEDSEFILPADRCTWHIQPDVDSGGYRVVNVKYYDGNTTDPSDQAGNWRTGYIGKTGRFVPITNTTDIS